MMADLTTIRKVIDDALTAGGFYTNAWVIVMEHVHDDGERVLIHEISEELADWTRVGMLYGAIEMNPYAFEEDEEDE